MSAAGQTIIDGLKYEAGGSAKFLTLHGIENETVNWVQTLNARKWPEKIMVGPGVEKYNAAFRDWKQKRRKATLLGLKGRPSTAPGAAQQARG